jgi:trehalose 6-phosphate phosphatase
MSDLEALARAASEGGIFCDFDGCLAPIVPDPDAARPVRGAGAVLERLTGRFHLVAVVSGRTAADLSRRVRARGVRLIGLHGMEEMVAGRVHTSDEAEAFRAAVERAGDALERALAGTSGAVLERKGLALAVHFRRAPDPDAAERAASPIVRSAAMEAGLVVVPGRRVLEVRPQAAGDKGDVVRRLIARERLRAGLVAGDDTGDVPAFAALDALEIAVRVAVVSAESPPELAARADIVVSSPREVVSLLGRLAAAR